MRTVTQRRAAANTVSVNDAVIAHADIAREVQNHPAPTPKQAWGAATHALVVRELLLQRARSMHFVVKLRSENGARETDEDALIRTLIETEIATPKADEARAGATIRPTRRCSAYRTRANFSRSIRCVCASPHTSKRPPGAAPSRNISRCSQAKRGSPAAPSRAPRPL